jgi:hypothetical protein
MWPFKKKTKDNLPKPKKKTQAEIRAELEAQCDELNNNPPDGWKPSNSSNRVFAEWRTAYMVFGGEVTESWNNAYRCTMLDGRPRCYEPDCRRCGFAPTTKENLTHEAVQ